VLLDKIASTFIAPKGATIKGEDNIKIREVLKYIYE
jgi:hypothetical protein